MKYTDMYPQMTEGRQWVVIRVLGNRKFATPWSYPSKAGAIKFCEANGFKKGER